MSDYTNISTGLKIISQIPLDVKKYVKDEATLAYLGVDDNLAFTYHDQLEVLCLAEKTLYIWREVQEGEENTGLIPLDYTYPANLSDVYGINYSGRTFNFFKKEYVTPQELENYILQTDLPSYLPSYDVVSFGDNSGPYGTDYDITNIVLSKKVVGNHTEFRLAGLGVKSDSALVRTQYQYIPGVGEDSKSSIIIDFVPNINNSVTAELIGNGSILNPFTVETLNPQKTIGTFPYDLTSADDQYTIFVNNAGNNVVIRIPDTLKDNFTCVFIQKGTGTVTFTGINSSVLNVPAGLTNVIRGQFHQAILEKDTNTVNYYIGGSLTPIP